MEQLKFRTLKVTDRVTLDALSKVAAVFGADVQKHFEAREEALRRLEGIADRVLIEIEDSRKRLESQYAEKGMLLEKELTTKSASLDQQHLAREGELDARQAALEKQQKDVDDRAAIHARRKTFDETPVEHPADILGNGLVRLKATTEGTELEIDRRRRVRRKAPS